MTNLQSTDTRVLMPRPTLAAALLAFSLVIPANALAAAPDHEPDSLASQHIFLRGFLYNSRLRFQRDRVGHVAFIGGSITAMNGYRPMVCQRLQKRFPQTEFTFTDAGISSTCSTTGAFRLSRDVLSKGPVDLIFIEFAVNDDQDAAHTSQNCVRGMEGILRQTRIHNPHADIIITYFVNPGMLASLQKGQTPVAIAAHQAVARHYNISTIHLAARVADDVTAGRLTWDQYGGTHPKPFGNAICAEMIERLLDVAWKTDLPADALSQPHDFPAKPLDQFSFGQGRLLATTDARLGGEWKVIEPDWKNIAGQCRPRFLGRELLCASQAGSELALSFTGRAIGAYLLAGPDSGSLSASVDGGAFQTIDLYHRYSKSLHYPRSVMFAAELAPGPHTLTLRVRDKKNQSSAGHAVRILNFVAN